MASAAVRSKMVVPSLLVNCLLLPSLGMWDLSWLLFYDVVLGVFSSFVIVSLVALL